MKLLLTYILITFSTINSTQFSSSQANEDLQFLKQELLTYHSGLDRYTSLDSIEYYFELAAVDQTIDSYELYSRVTSLLSKVGCGHTRSRMSNQMRSFFEREQSFIPFTVKIINGRYFIRESLDNELQEEEEIISINGVDILEIQKTIYNHLPGDGWITTGKKKRTEYLFDSYFQLFCEPMATRYEVATIDKQDRKVTTVKGVTWSQINAIRKREFAGSPYLSLAINENYAYMQIRTFSSNAIRNSGLNYEDFLEESFSKLESEKADNLILDLRGNGGGSDNYGALLVSYFAKEPFHYFDRIEVTESYPGQSIRQGEKYLMTDHKGLSQWLPKKNAFQGDVYVLIDGFSFSTCADVATVLHHHNWATFIGEETGGGYDGNTSGHTRTITLPNSKIIVNVPMWMYTTANIGHSYHGRGVIPDYAIEPTWQEYSDGRDVAMEKALELMK